MSGKVAVVTGGNKGIGFAIVKALCKSFDGDVILTARDEARGVAAAEALRKEGLNPRFALLDITREESVQSLATHLKEKYSGLDVLVNNAAIAFKMADTTPFAKQAEDTVAVNFFATLNVCHALFPLLRPHARVVNVSSSAGVLSNIPGEAIRQKFLSADLTEGTLCDLMRQFVSDSKAGLNDKNGWGSRAYSVSKAGVTALTFLQQKGFDAKQQDMVVNAVHPGYVDTDMSSHKGPLSPDQGADAPVYCALLPPGTSSPKGEFVWNDKTVRSWI